MTEREIIAAQERMFFTDGAIACRNIIIERAIEDCDQKVEILNDMLQKAINECLDERKAVIRDADEKLRRAIIAIERNYQAERHPRLFPLPR